ncbi:hypothetical protein Csa_009509 [Cucumis sativus]|uniref:Uncharacterized protein n=1 Tax=Cucumis sativus TaxID=3659 RepID=A0A0A0LA12_CUCSA|nr:hypothetical protein Csa_009509 [Cucumis sativus]
MPHSSNTKTSMATPTTTTMVAVAIIVVVSTIGASHCKAASLNSNLGNETTTAATSSTWCNSLDKECLIGVEDDNIETSAFPSLYNTVRTANGQKAVCGRVGRYDNQRCLPQKRPNPIQKCSTFTRSC